MREYYKPCWACGSRSDRHQECDCARCTEPTIYEGFFRGFPIATELVVSVPAVQSTHRDSAWRCLSLSESNVAAYRCFRSWLGILPYGWACTATLAGATIVGHDRFLMYYGGEFTAAVVREYFARIGVTTLYIEPGSPWENGYNESYMDPARAQAIFRNERNSVAVVYPACL
jgi:hypothetical protein